jgi:hypothetical protein
LIYLEEFHKDEHKWIQKPEKKKANMEKLQRSQKKFHFFELVKACSSRGFVTSHLESCI